jgi:hypothetical protein
LHDPADPFKWIREARSRIAGNPYQEGTAAYKAYDLGWDMGREQLIRDVTTADPKKLAAMFTKHFILMRPDIFQKRLAAERKQSS